MLHTVWIVDWNSTSAFSYTACSSVQAPKSLHCFCPIFIDRYNKHPILRKTSVDFFFFFFNNQNSNYVVKVASCVKSCCMCGCYSCISYTGWTEEKEKSIEKEDRQLLEITQHKQKPSVSVHLQKEGKGATFFDNWCGLFFFPFLFCSQHYS